MPVYVYRNLKTGETFEVEQRITESAWTEHPDSGDPVKRLVQPVGIAFKGSGFYVTDSRGSPPAGAKGAKGDAASASSDGESGGKSEPADGGSKGDGTRGTKTDAQSGGSSSPSGSTGQS